jgi:hypothetical protein
MRIFCEFYELLLIAVPDTGLYQLWRLMIMYDVICCLSVVIVIVCP